MADTHMNRRAFAHALAAGIAAGAVAAPALAAPAIAQNPNPIASSAEAEVNAKVARIAALYGKRLTPAQMDRVRRTVAGHVAMLDRIRGEAMVNSDPPATVLRLVHGEGQ